MPITYDPLHPEVVLATGLDVAPTDGSEWEGGVGFALPSTVGAFGVGLWILLGLRRPMARKASL